MDNAVRVEVGHCVCELEEDAGALALCKPRLLDDPVKHLSARDQLEDKVEVPLGLERVDDLDNPRVLDGLEDLDLVHERLGAEVLVEAKLVDVNNLDGHSVSRPQVSPQLDLGKRARPERVLERVERPDGLCQLGVERLCPWAGPSIRQVLKQIRDTRVGPGHLLALSDDDQRDLVVVAQHQLPPLPHLSPVDKRPV